MPKVGVRELKNDTSRIIRAVREERAEYVVTFRGEPVAVIVPVSDEARNGEEEGIIAASQPDKDFWRRWDALADETAAAWTNDKSAVELIEEQRRDL